MDKIIWFEVLVSLVNIHIILSNVFLGKIRIRIAFVLWFSVVLPCFILSFFYSGHSIGQIAIALCNISTFLVPIFTMANLRKTEILFVVLLYIGVSSTLIIICLWISRIFMLGFIMTIYIDIILQLLLFSLCIALSKSKTAKNIFRQIGSIPYNLKIMLIISVWSSDALAYFLSSFLSEFSRSTRLTVIECLVSLMILFIGIMWPFLIANNVAINMYKTVLGNLEGHMREQVRYYELINKANKDIRTFQHDYNNLRLGLASFLDNRDLHGALRYLQECDKPFKSDYIIYETGNYVADALLSEKQSTALLMNATITFEGIIPNLLIDATDVCVILGNALDNAIEACSKISTDDQKTIEISSNMNNGFLFLTILNPTLENVIIKDNSLVTSKSDKDKHGIGLQSILTSVKKYDGDMTLSCENTLFAMKIVMDFNSRQMLQCP